MKAQVCPVCGGKGKVPKAFYEPWRAWEPSSTNPAEEWIDCKACGGRGIIFVPEIEKHEPPPKPTDVWWTETARIEVKWEG